jgi:hypothetical protein
MIRTLFILFFTILLFVSEIQAAEPFEATACRSGKMTVVQGSKELMILGVELTGILRSNTEMFNNTSEICVGIFKKMGDETIQMGYCKYLYPDGDINVVEWDGSRNEGKWKYLLGTGKWENITGGGTWKNLQRAKSIADGTFQNCIMLNGTYELPK